MGNYDLARTWADIGGATPTAATPVIDGRSMFSLLQSNGAAEWNRTYTLQEGYQCCEGGSGEGKACSHKTGGEVNHMCWHRVF